MPHETPRIPEIQKAEEEGRRQAGKGNHDWKGRLRQKSPCKSNPAGGRRSTAPTTIGRGMPTPTPKGEQQGAKQTVLPSSPSANAVKKG